MKYILILSGVVIVGGVGAWLFGVTSEERPGGSTAADVTQLDVVEPLEIVTEDAVAYYPNALGFYAEPATPGEYPGVVMVHENRGLRPEIKQEAEALAREGYRVLAVDLYQGTVMETQEEARAYDGYDQTEGLANLQTATEYLRERGATKLASLGWCFGGRQSVELAISGTQLDATVVYYGGGMATSTEQLMPIDWPVLGIFGDEDRVIPIEMVNDFERSLNTLGLENEIYVYEGVGHAFANPSNPNFAPEPTAEAWSRTLSFLERNLQ